jgi:hypothetical protein
VHTYTPKKKKKRFKQLNNFCFKILYIYKEK